MGHFILRGRERVWVESDVGGDISFFKEYPDTKGKILFLNDIVINDGVAIEYQGKSKHVIFPDIPLRGINSYMFYKSDIESVIVPNTVERLCHHAFFECSKLKYVHFGGEIRYVDDRVFEKCRRQSDSFLSEPNSIVTFKNSKKNFNSSWTDFTIHGDFDVDQIYIDGDENIYALKNNGTASLLRYYSKERTYTIPNEVNGHRVVEIFDDAFYHRLRLDSVELPNSIVRIGNGAFQDSGIKFIDLPKGLQEIGRDAFSSCSYLKKIVIPSTVKKMGTCMYLDESVFFLANPKLKIYVERGCDIKSWNKGWNQKNLVFFNLFYSKYKYRII